MSAPVHHVKTEELVQTLLTNTNVAAWQVLREPTAKPVSLSTLVVLIFTNTHLFMCKHIYIYFFYVIIMSRGGFLNIFNALHCVEYKY